MSSKKYKTIGSIESFTGGLFATTITKNPGASKYFKGSLITYSSEIKEKLNIDTSNGVVNERVAREMALKGQKYLGVDLCISFTGVAGPTSIENKKVGTIFIALNSEVFELFLKGNREDIREQAVVFALKKMNELIDFNT